jgi:hypothetical protein
MFLKKFALALALALTALSVPAQAAGPKQTVAVAPLSSIEVQDLTYMREEEKLARDIYLKLDGQWGLVPFANVSAGEQNHMDAVLKLLRKYRLPDPAAGLLIGEFANSELQALYDKLLEQGLLTNIDALKVGGVIEEADILDLADAMAHADNVDLDVLYGNLQCGSRNHLRAFAGWLQAITGQAYQAQVIAQEDVDAILATAREKCGR